MSVDLWTDLTDAWGGGGGVSLCQNGDKSIRDPVKCSGWFFVFFFLKCQRFISIMILMQGVYVVTWSTKIETSDLSAISEALKASHPQTHTHTTILFS